MQVASNVLDRQYKMFKPEYDQKIIEVLERGHYINGPEVENFEKEFAKYCGAKYCVGLASGLDALWLAFRILDIHEGDEVIVQSNTYIATVMGITINGATPIFVEPDEFFNMDVSKVEEKITPRAKAILVTHLYGQATDMTTIMEIAQKHNLLVVEDCAQAHGAQHAGKTVGTFGIIGCYSFYPSKNLGAFGDAGAIVTDDPEIAAKFRMYRNYGSEKRYYNKVIGTNSRLDELQAALLRVKLTHIDELEKDRFRIVNRYLSEINNPVIELPKEAPNSKHVWHQFVIKTKYRDEFQNFLAAHDITTLIHYPIPPHLAEAYQDLGYKKGDLPIAEAYANEVLSLPLYNGMTDEEQSYVIDAINNFKPEE